mgnify:FL=1
MPHKDEHRDAARKSGTYDVYIEIDIDCEELVDACGLAYTRSETDDTQNEIMFPFTKDEYVQAFSRLHIANLNEQFIGGLLLNPELGEYTTKVTIYTPQGDKITFE